jgi:uncharacterized membrane protein YgcG
VHGMHKWGSSVMMILIFLHMARTFFFGAYKYPRELNWVIGVVLLILTFTMSFTGYLLPFDQRSYWATVVGVNINGTGPLVGPYLNDFLYGGPDFNATTLARFYSIHMLLLPGLIAALIGAHLWLVMKHGTTAPPWLKPREHGHEQGHGEAAYARRGNGNGSGNGNAGGNGNGGGSGNGNAGGNGNGNGGGSGKGPRQAPGHTKARGPKSKH